MRPQDHSIRDRAHGLSLLAAVAAVGIVHAYVAGRSPIAVWVLFVAALVGAVHFYRRSRK